MKYAIESLVNAAIGIKLNKHQRIALQFSGGRDSIACLYLMSEFLDRITVYWLNTGDPFPETLRTIEQVQKMAPHFVEVRGRQPEVINEFGLPSDLVPASRTPLGLFGSGDAGILIQDRYSCCLRSRMIPLHERMIADGVTLIIRGQKDSDREKGILKSGDVDSGIEYLFPLESWSNSDVMKYLREQHATIPRFYEMLDEAPECMTCSAWWENGAAKYLKRYHFDAYKQVQERLDAINQAVGKHIANFNKEVST